jgi:nicotinamide-nucleotide amidase
MFAEIITIGDEILIGQIVDTNSAYICKELNKIGVSVYQITSVQDDKEHIIKSLKEAEDNADIILITGGLGPTKDDITKRTICEYFDDVLVQNDEVLSHVETLFEKYIATPLLEVNRKQALVPSKATVLMNKFGTAPGTWMEKNGKVFISMPGVPYEMKALMLNEVLPRLQDKYHFPFIFHKTILTYGMGESAIADKIESWEDSLPSFIKLAYLPSLGRVRLRLSAKGTDKGLIEDEVEKQAGLLHQLIGDIIVGYEDDNAIEVIIGKLLTEKKQTISTAESCTGGKIAEQFTANAGASVYFKGSVVSYATEAKINVLRIPQEIIEEHSVVSIEVAEAMARNVKEIFKTDYAIATTGNAGPTKGDSDVEVGTVCIAIATPNTLISGRFEMGNHRTKVINKTMNKSFELLLKEILKN